LETRIAVEGDLDVVLSPSAAETIGLAFHELATNAAKYGAMSSPKGEINVRCSVVDNGVSGRLRIVWEERNGPPIKPPKTTGFGTVMINRNPRLSLGAEVECGYPPSGFFWQLTVPLLNVQAAR
jgi:two-component sensor histidine kinase